MKRYGASGIHCREVWRSTRDFPRLRKMLVDVKASLESRTLALDSLVVARDPELPPLLHTFARRGVRYASPACKRWQAAIIKTRQPPFSRDTKTWNAQEQQAALAHAHREAGVCVASARCHREKANSAR